MKKIFTLENIIGLLGIFMSLASFIGNWNFVISAALSTTGLLLTLWAVITISSEHGEPYKHLKYFWSVKILDKSGKRSTVQLLTCLRIRKKIITEGGTSWSNFPYNLKTYIAYDDDGKLPLDKMEIPHGPPQKRSSMYYWPYYLNPPLRRGQTIWIIDEFEMKNEYTKSQICDYFNSFRTIDEFVWKFHFPPERPAKRWFGMVDYLPREGDKKILAEGNEFTTEVVWRFKNTKKGVVYNLIIDW